MSDDLLISVKQINDKYKSCIYVLYADSIMVATTTKYEMDKFLESEDPLITVHDDNIENAILVHGIVLNNLELPFEIPEELMEGRYLWLIKDEGNSLTSMEFFCSVKDVTEAIEEYLEDDAVCIDDFAVILAEDIDMCLRVGATGKTIQIAKVYE
jgi:hypothetical protein